jgi:hypothetical protein
VTQQELIAAVRGDLDEQEQIVREELSHLDGGALNWKPGPDEWSVAQCLDHLIRSADPYLELLNTAISGAQPRGEDPFRPTWIGNKMATAVAPDAPANIPVPKPFVPGDGPFDEAVLHRFLQQLDELRPILVRAEAVDLNKTKMSSPIAKVVRFNLGDGLLILGIHGVRHTRQARRVAKSPGFPGASKLPS